MPRSRHPEHASRSRPQHKPSPLFRTRNWLGQERVAFVYRNRRYLFRRAEAATWARHQIMVRRRSYIGWMALVTMLLVLLGGAWVISFQPIIAQRAIDAAQAVIGQAPVTFFESQVSRLDRLARQLPAAFDNAPPWDVRDAAAAEQPPTIVPTVTNTATPKPTHTPTITPKPTATPTPTPSPEVRVVIRGGNMRRVPVLNDDNVLGWVMPGDHVEIMAGGQNNAYWLRVRLIAYGEAKDDQSARLGSEGWISTILFEPAPPTPVPPTPTPAPTEPLLFNPTPVAATPNR